MEPIRDEESVQLFRRIRERPARHAHRNARAGDDRPQRPRAPRGRRVRLVADEPEVDERCATSNGRAADRRRASRCARSTRPRSERRSLRVHPGRHRRPDRVGLRRPHGRQIHQRRLVEQTRERRQPSFGDPRQDVVERRAVEQQHDEPRPGVVPDFGRGQGRHRRRRQHGRSARGQREHQRRARGEDEQRRADAAAAAAERIVRDGDREEHGGRRRRRERAHGHAPRGVLGQRGLEGAHVQPHQHRRERGERRTHPREHPDARPSRRQHAKHEELADDDDDVERDGEMQAVEKTDRHEPAPRARRQQRHLRVQLQHENREVGRAQHTREQRVREHPQEAHDASVRPYVASARWRRVYCGLCSSTSTRR